MLRTWFYLYRASSHPLISFFYSLQKSLEHYPLLRVHSNSHTHDITGMPEFNLLLFFFYRRLLLGFSLKVWFCA